MARPYVEVIGVHAEHRVAIAVDRGRHLQLDVLVRDVRLLIIHPAVFD
jgi:hypothetical protein